MSYGILFEGVWNAYAAGNLLKIKKREKRSMPVTNKKNVWLFWNDSQKVACYELKKNTWIKVTIGCIFGELW